jgi:hypothetical protein
MPQRKIEAILIRHTLAVRGGYVLENPRKGKTAMSKVKTLREKWD